MSVRPTADGAAVLVLAGLLLLVAVNLQAGWVFAVDALLWGAVAVAWAGARTALRGLEVSRRLPAEVTEGGEVSVTLTLRVRRGRRFALTVHDAVPGLEARSLAVADVSSRPVTITYRTAALRRGAHRVDDVKISTAGLLGLLAARGRIRADGSLVVLPRYWPLDRIPSPGPAETDSPAARRLLRDGLEVAGVRDYRDGDSLRHVHWRSTARRGRLAVREFEDDLRDPVAVLLDTRRDFYEGAMDAFEDLVRAAASVVHLAARSGHPVLLAGSADRTGMPMAWRQALLWLASVQPGGEYSPLEQHLLVPPGSRAVVLSADADVLLALARRGAAVAAVFADVPAYRRRAAAPGPGATASDGPSHGSILTLEALGIPVAVLRGGQDPGAVLARWGS